MQDSQLIAAKAAARTELRALRARQAPAERSAAAGTICERIRQLPELRLARVVFCFIARGDEVETRSLIDWLLADGRRILVPKIQQQAMLAIPFPGWERLRPGVLGIPAPDAGTEPAGRVDAVITPGLGFSHSGQRLGMGRGYYDRWFATHDYGASIAPCFEFQLLPRIPVGPQDRPVDIIVTEQRTLRCS